MKNIYYFTIAFWALTAALPTHADDPRFSRVLEFELMSRCVGDAKSRGDKIWLCACALEKTQENGLWPDYDSDRKYGKDREKFVRDYSKNIRYFAEHMDKCLKK